MKRKELKLLWITIATLCIAIIDALIRDAESYSDLSVVGRIFTVLFYIEFIVLIFLLLLKPAYYKIRNLWK